MKLFKRSVELVVIRDYLNPQNGMEFYQGDCIEKLLKLAFGASGLSSSIKIYHNNIAQDVTPKTPQDVDKLMRLNGRFCAVVKPMGLTPLDWAIIGISPLASVAVAFLMPMPNIPTQGQNPSPNNALASRTNKQRLGGRIPDIFGTVYSIPDLIAVTYSEYIDGREVEYSYMCVGRGKHHVFEAYDDTTPIKYVRGSSVLVYNPDDTLDDEPAFVFGDQFSPSEAEFARFAAKRYTSVNGQDLAYPDSYDTIPITMRAPNIIETSDTLSLTRRYKVGDTISVEDANDLESGNGVVIVDGETSTPVIYNLSGSYEIATVTDDQITLVSPELVNADWQMLSDNADFTVEQDITISQNTETLWQGYHYTEDKDHDGAYINIVALNGIYATNSEGKPYPRKVEGVIESELVDVNGNAIAGTLHTQTFFVQSPSEYAGVDSSEENIKRTAATTVKFTNPHFIKGKRMRFRVARTTERLTKKGGQVVQDIKLKDFYSYRVMTGNDYLKGVTTVYTKTLATEGALSLKERKLRLLVQRYVTDATSGLPKLSNRADDILRDIATDPKIGNLQLTQVDIAQIKTEIDAQIAYFGTDKCSEFCGTFDDNNLSAEETMQIVAKAVFSQAKRQGNKIMLDFERKVPASVAVFNSHNILPDTFTAPQSLGIANDYDGVKIEYTDPIDDAIITMSYPNDAITNPHEDKLIGVRNKVQAHMHMMRMYNKDRHAYKSCEFVAGDESNIVVRTNRITVADQLRADVQQGSVESIETIGGDIVLHTTDHVTIEPSGAYTMFIQTINNGVESIAVTARDDYSVNLARLPSGEISGTDKVVQAVYQIVSETDDNRDAYLVAQKDPSDGMTNKLLCTNYDDRYYQNDKDHIAPHVFTPLDLFAGGKQGVWYDPSDKSTLFQDVAGTVPVTKDGDPVALMRDKSGNGNHATQTVSTARPIYKTDGILHWLKPDGVDDALFTNYIVKPPMSLFVGTYMPNTGDTSQHAMVSSGQIGAPLNDFAFYTDKGELKFTTYGSRYIANGIALPPESPQVVYVKGMRTSVTLGAVGGASKSGVATGEWATNYMRLFYDESSSRRGVQPFYGLCLIEEDLASDKSNQVGQYLAKKSGVTL